MKYLLPLILLSLFAAGCKKVDSNDLKDDVPFYQYYDLVYDKTANTLSASAYFRVRNSSGTKIELTDNASVMLNGFTPGSSATDNATYKWNLTGLPDANFVLTKNSGQIFSNTVLRSESGDIDIANLPASALKINGFIFSWTGTPYNAATESITVTVSGSTTGGSIINKQVTSNQVQITAAELQNFNPGQVTVSLFRVRTLNVKMPDGNAGGVIYTKVYTQGQLILN